MKNIISKSSLVLSLLFIAVLANAQTAEAVAYASVPDRTTGIPATETITFSTNLNEVLSEVGNYLKTTLKAPETLDFYNTDVVVLASFSIAENGEIKNIRISRKSDKGLGEIVVRELGKLSKTTPVLENGKAVEKHVNIPVVFKAG